MNPEKRRCGRTTTANETPVNPCAWLRPNWPPGVTAELLARVRECFEYVGDDARATGYLFHDGEQDWPAPLAACGPCLLNNIEQLTGERFGIVAFQAYRHGRAVADWHRDLSFPIQAILSLGASRTLAVRDGVEAGDEMWRAPISDGDVVYMPGPWEHAILPDPEVSEERVSLVFRRGA